MELRLVMAIKTMKTIKGQQISKVIKAQEWLYRDRGRSTAYGATFLKLSSLGSLRQQINILPWNLELELTKTPAPLATLGVRIWEMAEFCLRKLMKHEQLAEEHLLTAF